MPRLSQSPATHPYSKLKINSIGLQARTLVWTVKSLFLQSFWDNFIYKFLRSRARARWKSIVVCIHVEILKCYIIQWESRTRRTLTPGVRRSEKRHRFGVRELGFGELNHWFFLLNSGISVGHLRNRSTRPNASFFYFRYTDTRLRFKWFFSDN